MMRPPPRTKKPSAVGVQELRYRSIGAAGGQSDDPKSVNGDSKQRLVDDFESALRAQPELDRDDQDLLLGHYKAVVAETTLDPDVTNGFDRSTWTDVLEALKNAGAISEDESHALFRQFDEVFNKLEKDDVRIALEFARRCRVDGESEALVWLAAQRQKTAEQKTAKPSEQVNPVPRKGSATSRSLSSRGPPRRR